MMRRAARDTFAEQAALHSLAAVNSETPFRERLARFWANHFTVSVRQPKVTAIAMAYEREAIRPFVVGRFEDMLIETARHPAMLLYLDNAASIGPNSAVGRRSKRGLNENLAREILELHTLGVDGGYGQEDVIALAKMLTGWSVEHRDRDGVGRFQFYPSRHEPGAKRFLGTIIPESGMDEAKSALRLLARHPSTAEHSAWKLATHFVSDRPPMQAVALLKFAYLESAGDLRALSASLVHLRELWTPQLDKVKPHTDFVISAARALGLKLDDGKPLLRAQRVLGQMPYTAPSPAGWPDENSAWVSPEALLERLEWGAQLADLAPNRRDPLGLADSVLGPLLSETSRTWIGRAPSPRDGLAMFLAAPAFQRR